MHLQSICPALILLMLIPSYAQTTQCNERENKVRYYTRADGAWNSNTIATELLQNNLERCGFGSDVSISSLEFCIGHCSLRAQCLAVRFDGNSCQFCLTSNVHNIDFSTLNLHEVYVNDSSFRINCSLVIKSIGYDDPGYFTNRDSYVMLNGVLHRGRQMSPSFRHRGIGFLAFNPATCQVEAQGMYDTFRSENLTRDFIADVHQVPADSLIVIMTGDSFDRKFYVDDGAAISLLSELGSPVTEHGLRSSLALLAYKNQDGIHCPAYAAYAERYNGPIIQEFEYINWAQIQCP